MGLGEDRDLGFIILAAGKGTRMRSERAKVLHEVAGQPMIRYPVRIARELGSKRTVVVVSSQAEKVKAVLADEGVLFADQGTPLGTGHAVLSARSQFEGFDGDIVILLGDVPLIEREVIEALLRTHRTRQADVTLLAAESQAPTGYGRVVRDGTGDPLRIVEELDATDEERKITNVNTGTYAARAACLFEVIARIGNRNRKGEFYLTDLVELAREGGRKLAVHIAPDFSPVQGVNTMQDLYEVERSIRHRILSRLMESGVRVLDPESVYVDLDVEVGPDTVLSPGVHLRGRTRVGRACRIGPGVVLDDAEIGNGAEVAPFCVIEESEIGEEATIDPLCWIGPGNRIEKGAQVSPIASSHGRVPFKARSTKVEKRGTGMETLAGIDPGKGRR